MKKLLKIFKMKKNLFLCLGFFLLPLVSVQAQGVVQWEIRPLEIGSRVRFPKNKQGPWNLSGTKFLIKGSDGLWTIKNKHGATSYQFRGLQSQWKFLQWNENILIGIDPSSGKNIPFWYEPKFKKITRVADEPGVNWIQIEAGPKKSFIAIRKKFDKISTQWFPGPGKPPRDIGERGKPLSIIFVPHKFSGLIHDASRWFTWEARKKGLIEIRPEGKITISKMETTGSSSSRKPILLNGCFAWRPDGFAFSYVDLTPSLQKGPIIRLLSFEGLKERVTTDAILWDPYRNLPFSNQSKFTIRFLKWTPDKKEKIEKYSLWWVLNEISPIPKGEAIYQFNFSEERAVKAFETHIGDEIDSFQISKNGQKLMTVISRRSISGFTSQKNQEKEIWVGKAGSQNWNRIWRGNLIQTSLSPDGTQILILSASGLYLAEEKS